MAKMRIPPYRAIAPVVADFIAHIVNPNKFTRVLMKNGKTFIGHFSRELLKENHWILIQGGSNERIDINGNDIVSLKENN